MPKYTDSIAYGVHLHVSQAEPLDQHNSHSLLAQVLNNHNALLGVNNDFAYNGQWIFVMIVSTYSIIYNEPCTRPVVTRQHQRHNSETMRKKRERNASCVFETPTHKCTRLARAHGLTENEYRQQMYPNFTCCVEKRVPRLSWREQRALESLHNSRVIKGPTCWMRTAKLYD